MTLLENFNKLHVGIKSISLSVISIIPFYFVSMYLFEPKIFLDFHGKSFFINNFDVIFIFSLCFVFSLTWVVSNVFLSVGISIIMDKITGKEPDIEMPFVFTFFYSICYLAITILINYYITKYSLLAFVLFSHVFLFFRFSWTFFWYLYLKKTGQIPYEI